MDGDKIPLTLIYKANFIVIGSCFIVFFIWDWDFSFKFVCYFLWMFSSERKKRGKKNTKDIYLSHSIFLHHLMVYVYTFVLELVRFYCVARRTSPLLIV